MPQQMQSIVDGSIRELRQEEARRIAEIHAAALPDDFFPSLGIDFLSGYYSDALNSSSKNKLALLGAFERGVLIGFCQVSFETHSFVRIIEPRNLLRFIGMVIAKPKNFINGLIQFFQVTKNPIDTAEIAFIAVAPSCQGKGVGGALISEAMAECRVRKINWLTTKTSNKDLGSFYRREFNAELVKEFSAVGQSYEILKWKVTP